MGPAVKEGWGSRCMGRSWKVGLKVAGGAGGDAAATDVICVLEVGEKVRPGVLCDRFGFPFFDPFKELVGLTKDMETKACFVVVGDGSTAAGCKRLALIDAEDEGFEAVVRIPNALHFGEIGIEILGFDGSVGLADVFHKLEESGVDVADDGITLAAQVEIAEAVDEELFRSLMDGVVAEKFGFVGIILAFE